MLMSEDAGAATGTEAAPQGTDAAATDAEDAEAQALLDGMSETPEDLAAELAKWKSEARKWEGRSKSNSEAAARLKELEQQNMSELEKAQALAKDAEERATAATAMHNRVMAAAAHNLPVELIDDLGSGTEEEINERAERLSGVIETRAQEIANEILAQSANRNGMPLGARPVESMRAGSAPASGGTPTSPEEWFRRLIDSRREQ
jgi:hypothetical protein